MFKKIIFNFLITFLAIQSTFSANQPPAPRDGIIESDYGIEIRKLKLQHRVGVGGSIAGPLAGLGVNVEMNLMSDIGLNAGIGTGFDYNSYMLQARYYFVGNTFAPYLGLGFSRWSTGTKVNSIGDVIPRFLTENFLSKEQLQDKVFGVNMYYPSIGVQYVNLENRYGIYVEFDFLVNISNGRSAGYGGGGLVWYL